MKFSARLTQPCGGDGDAALALERDRESFAHVPPFSFDFFTFSSAFSLLLSGAAASGFPRPRSSLPL